MSPIDAAFIAPPLPANEPQRLATLAALKVLDTAADPVLDAIVARLCALYETPVGLVSLVDADRQWFMARSGLSATETPRAVSFCGHALQSLQPFVVTDARRDARFAGNPLVTGPPHVVFYAGMPLVFAPDVVIGTLCAIDHRPRATVPPATLKAHRDLANDVVLHLAARVGRSS